MFRTPSLSPVHVGAAWTVSPSAGASVRLRRASVVSDSASVVYRVGFGAGRCFRAGRGVVVAAAGCGNESQADQQCTDALHA